MDDLPASRSARTSPRATRPRGLESGRTSTCLSPARARPRFAMRSVRVICDFASARTVISASVIVKMTLARRRARAPSDAMAPSTARTRRARDVDARSPPLDVDAPPRSARTGATRRRVMAVVAAGGAPRATTPRSWREATTRATARARRDAPSARRARDERDVFARSVVWCSSTLGVLREWFSTVRANAATARRRDRRGRRARVRRARRSASARARREGRWSWSIVFGARAIGNAIRRELAGTAAARVRHRRRERHGVSWKVSWSTSRGDDAGAMRVAQLGWAGRDDARRRRRVGKSCLRSLRSRGAQL